MHPVIKSNSLKKWITFIVIDLLLVISLILFIIFARPFSPPLIKMNGVFINQPKNINDFQLIDQNGNVFTKNQLKGRWSLLFFGFTHCPNICPTTLDALAKMYFILQEKLPASLLPQVIFITIDPERDTQARLKQYISAYHSHFIAARADIAKTKALKKQFFIKVTGSGDAIEHSTDIVILNPQAQIQAYFLFPHRPKSMASDYEQLIKLR